MKKQYDILRTDLQQGDIVVNSNPGNPWIKVEREVRLEYKVGMRLSTAEEFEEAPVGSLVIDGDGDAWQRRYSGWSFSDDNRTGEELADGTFGPFTLVYIGGTQVAEITAEAVISSKPLITREHFIKVMKAVVEDNMLDTGEEFTTVLVFAADRLGLY